MTIPNSPQTPKIPYLPQQPEHVNHAAPINHHCKRPKQSLPQRKVLREDLDNFKAQLRTLLGRINTNESEENAKNHLRDFLNDTGYKDQHLIATKGRADLVIHSEKKASSPVSVLFEVKRPRGQGDPQSAEIVSRERMNAKALHELILYYLGIAQQ